MVLGTSTHDSALFSPHLKCYVSKLPSYKDHKINYFFSQLFILKNFKSEKLNERYSGHPYIVNLDRKIVSFNTFEIVILTYLNAQSEYMHMHICTFNVTGFRGTVSS